MKVVKWDEIHVDKIKEGDVIKWRQDCETCGNSRESTRVTVINIDLIQGELIVNNHNEKQIWDIFTDVKYLRKRQEKP